MGMRGRCLRKFRLIARAAGGQLSELLPLGLRSSRRLRACSAARGPQRAPSWAATAEGRQAETPSPADSRPSWTRWRSIRPRPWSATPASPWANSAEQPRQGHLPRRGPSLRRRSWTRSLATRPRPRRLNSQSGSDDAWMRRGAGRQGNVEMSMPREKRTWRWRRRLQSRARPRRRRWSHHRRPPGSSARSSGARRPTRGARPAGRMSRPCAPIWKSIFADIWSGPSRPNGLRNALWANARCAPASCPSGSAAHAPGAVRRWRGRRRGRSRELWRLAARLWRKCAPPHAV